MNRDSLFAITVNREFGTGGREMARALAKSLDAALLDDVILKDAAQRLGMKADELEVKEIRRTSWWEDMAHFYAPISAPEYIREYTGITTRQLFNVESRIMREMAADRNCVIVGRCGFDILKDHPNKLSIFLTSPFDSRVRNVMGKFDMDEKSAAALVRKVDKARESYTKTFTGKNRYDASNYDICLNIATMTEQVVVDIIKRLVG